MIKAVRDMVIVEVKYRDQEGKIFIPDNAKQYNGEFWGEVVSVGPDNKKGLKAGDKIMFVRHEGHPIEYEDTKYLAVKDRWIEGRIE